MTQSEIIKNNELIYFFMATPLEKKLYKKGRFYFENSPSFLFKDSNVEFNIPKLDNEGNSNLAYHLSYDWLIPVVEKIELLGWNVNINKDCCIYDNEYKSTGFGKSITKTGNAKIEVVWLTIVEFIKWYNTQNQ